MNKFGYIYKTIDLVNNKIYVGKKKGSFDPKYLGSGIVLVNAVKKYGASNFVVEVIVYADDRDELNKLEKDYIAKYRQEVGRETLYNISAGGDGGDLGIDRKGSNNPMYGKRGKDNPLYIQREIRICPTCGKEFEVRITSTKRFCSKECISQGRVWIYNKILDKSIKVKRELVNDYLQDGWELGRGKQFKELCSSLKSGENNPMFGKGYLVKGEKNSQYGKRGSEAAFFGRHHMEEAKEKNRQSHLGKPAWNKGLTKETDSRVLKYALSRTKTTNE